MTAKNNNAWEQLAEYLDTFLKGIAQALGWLVGLLIINHYLK